MPLWSTIYEDDLVKVDQREGQDIYRVLIKQYNLVVSVIGKALEDWHTVIPSEEELPADG